MIEKQKKRKYWNHRIFFTYISI